MTERLFVRLDGDPLYAPETSVPAGTLREFAVPPDLQQWVAHVIEYREALPDGHEVKERVLPDGSVHLIFELQDGPAPSRIAGPRLGPAELRMRGNVDGLSLKLRPGAATALLGASAHELSGRVVTWQDVAPARARTLPDQLREAVGGKARVMLLAEALRRMRREPDIAGLDRARAAAQLLRQPAKASVKEVGETVGVSERRLQQIFRQHVGLAPRAWRRLMRVHGCLRRLRSGEPVCWATLALECGFADQPHLVNEFRAFSGLAPTQFQQLVVSRSSKTPG